ncbi:MAG: SUMF1/EgtB/PvdO family nonheme iron enzyme [Thiofilum sp.]|uniref:SUMF1/EgtB/PvdO family nonheme iron enzyme n=1 Tax=Thiofilum sp. TaxID=2212733 RepID=UPI0025E5DD03|nr:SUMF1/EgtB/PvdO family nonheme iron enzyme [Thiofilum sp.]MBK8455110.1 SUMF1/EgtB/PvdO family nonheme iron enzyme [Thiofilum sp.]
MSSEEKVRRADIFISYSHADDAWKTEIQKHLSVLQVQGGFSIWDDRQIKVGDDWLPAIEAAINQARVAILLVSADFLTSNFIARQEIPKFLERRKHDGLKVVPVVIRPCAWTRVRWLASLQGATVDNQPLARYTIGSHDCDEALTRIVEKVDDLLQEVIKREQESTLILAVQQPVIHASIQTPVIVKQPLKAKVSKPSKSTITHQLNLDESVRLVDSITTVKSSEQRLIECWKRRANFDLPFEPVVFPYKHEPDWGEDQYGLWQALDVKGIRHVFRWIPAGTFMMGSPEDEKGRYKNEDYHQVTLTKGLWLGETPITQAQYQSLMGNNPSAHKQHIHAPVEKVSFRNIQLFIRQFNDYCKSITVRLPWEAEWERACRANTQTAFYFEGELTLEKANYRGTWNDWRSSGGGAVPHTTPVKSYKPNSWGLYDMIGNVWEACADLYNDYLGINSVIDPKYLLTSNKANKNPHYVVKGGPYWEVGRGLRSAKRWHHSSGGYGSQGIGFRLAIGE